MNNNYLLIQCWIYWLLNKKNFDVFPNLFWSIYLNDNPTLKWYRESLLIEQRILGCTLIQVIFSGDIYFASCYEIYWPWWTHSLIALNYTYNTLFWDSMIQMKLAWICCLQKFTNFLPHLDVRSAKLPGVYPHALSPDLQVEHVRSKLHSLSRIHILSSTWKVYHSQPCVATHSARQAGSESTRTLPR